MIEQWLPDRAVLRDSDGNFDLIDCPVCGRSDRIQKCSGAVRCGSGVALPTGQPFVSDLVLTLSPPQPPRSFPYLHAATTAIWGWVWGFALYLVLVTLSGQTLVRLPSAPLSAASAATLAWFGVAIPVIALARALIEHRLASRRHPGWQSAFERWLRLFYCARDDIVFIPEERTAEAPERMYTLLYRPPFGKFAEGGTE